MSFLTPDQADTLITLIQGAFFLVLLPTLCNPNAQVPRLTSMTMAGGLYFIAIIYIGLGPLWSAAAMGVLSGLAWTFIAIRRPVKRPASMV